MKEYDTQTPYIASYVIIKKDNKIAFVLRSSTSWMNGYYGLPSGKAEKNENFTDCATREAKEEVGVDVSRQDLKYVHTVHRNEGLEWVDMYFEAVKYVGEPYNAEPHMHSELAWFSPDDLPDNVIPSVRDALKNISKGRYYSEFGWD